MQGNMGCDHQASLSTSPQFSARLAEHSRQLAGVQNEYSFALVSTSAHLEHYQRVELPAAMQVADTQTPRAPSPGSHKDHLPTASRDGVRAGCPGGSEMLQCGDVAVLGGFPPTFPQALDGDLYERLREHLSAASRTEVETCRATRDWFQGVVEASMRVMALSQELGETGGHR